MAVIQVFQAKLLCCMDKSKPDPGAFQENGSGHRQVNGKLSSARATLMVKPHIKIKGMDKLPQPQALKSLPHETTVQDGYFEADPLVHLSRPYSPSITGKS